MPDGETPTAKAAADTDADLPKALVKKIIKNKLVELDPRAGDAEGAKKHDIQINKDALLAFTEGAKVFINYLTATANDICKNAKRQTLSADDIFVALQDLDFAEFIQPVRDALETFKKDSKEKNKRKAELTKKRKAEEAEQNVVQAAPPVGFIEKAPNSSSSHEAFRPEPDYQPDVQVAYAPPDAAYAEEALDAKPAIPEALLH